MKLTGNLIGLFLTIAFVVACILPAIAQQKKNPRAAQQKTREVTIYVYQEFDEKSEEVVQRLVPVQRKIVDYRPLDAALKLLLEGPTEEERNRGLAYLVFDLKFFSARVRNKTAQINLKLDYKDYTEESWEGGGFDHERFVKAVELTARQFPGIEKVSICVNGIENYIDFGRTKDIKCSFPMFPHVKLPKLPRSSKFIKKGEK